MKSPKLRLPSPEAIIVPLSGRNKTIRRYLKVLADSQLSDLTQLASLELPDQSVEATKRVTVEKLGVEKFDMYDDYFEVERTSQNPADELAAAFLAALAEVGKEAKRGYQLDPLALKNFLRAVQVQAQVMLKEAYDG